MYSVGAFCFNRGIPAIDKDESHRERFDRAREFDRDEFRYVKAIARSRRYAFVKMRLRWIHEDISP